MSHTTKVTNVRVHDIEALKAALQTVASENNLSIEILMNDKCRLWASQRADCVLVARIAGCRFDVGFQNAPDGHGLVPIFDKHGGELYRIVGQGRDICKSAEDHNLSNIAKIMQAYAKQAIYEEALRQGGTVYDSTGQDGSVVMQVMQSA